MAGGPNIVENAGRHEHRFPYYHEGDTQLTCADCRQVVFIEPVKIIPRLTGKQVFDQVFNKAYPLPWLLIQAARKRPHYVDLAIRYDLWSIGRTRW